MPVCQCGGKRNAETKVCNRCGPYKQRTGVAISNNDARSIHADCYNSTQWRKLRASVLATSPWCIHCKVLQGKLTEAKHVDHIVPHSGIKDTKFLDLRNLQTLCIACHTRKSKLEQSNNYALHQRDKNIRAKQLIELKKNYSCYA